MARSRFMTWLFGVSIAAACYLFVYLLLLGYGIALGETDLAPQSPWAGVRDILGVVVTGLGFPLVSVLSSSSGLEWSRRIFGDKAILALAAVNSLIWGPFLFVIRQYVRSRRKLAA